MGTERQTYDSVYPSINDVVSRPQDNIVLVYGSTQKKTYKALAFQIIRAGRRIERVENLVTGLGDGETKEFGWVGEEGFSRDTSTPGKEVFRIESERNQTLVEYGITVPQDGVYVGLESGDGDVVNGLREGGERERGYSASDLPVRGAPLSDTTSVPTPSYSSEEPVPTTALSPQPHQQGVIRMDSKQDGLNRFGFAFNNQSGGVVDVDLTAVGMTYDVRPIQDSATAKQMLSGNGYARRLVNYGGFNNTNPNLPRDWYDYVVDIGSGELTPPM